LANDGDDSVDTKVMTEHGEAPNDEAI